MKETCFITPSAAVLGLIVLLSLLTLIPAARAGETCCSSKAADPVELHPFTVHDMLDMERISDPQASPCGAWVVFTLRVTDLDANRGRTDIWMAAVDGSQTRRLTAHPESDWNPRWTTCGTVAFLSTRSGSSQIWTIDPKGGEAVQFTDLPLGVSNLEFVPPLKSFIFTMDVYPGTTVSETVTRDEEKKSRARTGMVYDELLFRHWDSWEDGKRSHLFVRPCCGSDCMVRDLTPGLDADTPTHPWGGSEEFTVSPDGKSVVFTAKIAAGSEAAWNTDYDLYVVPTEGEPGEPRCLTEENEAWDTEPVFSPDGSTLAYLAMARPGFEADRFSIVLMNWKTGDKKVLTEAWDRSPHGLVWAPDGKTIYCTAGNIGQRCLFAVNVAGGGVRELAGDGSIGSLQLLEQRILFARNSLVSPNELWTVKLDGTDLKQVTGFNEKKLESCLMGEPEQFSFKGWNDEQVHAYVVKPYDFSEEEAAAGRKWPVTFLIHGGPQGSFGNKFHYRWNPQAYVGAGFCTVAVDFHGSTGYGQAFTDSISRHWGDRPYEDLVKGLAAALERYPWMDGGRVVAAGASFGGYMINWIHGQPFADSFKAFVCHDGNLDERMAYFDTEELWFPEWENGGPPWDAPDGAYEEFNPIEFVNKWKVPTMVVHGALDYRVVDTQGISTFTALRRQGVPARLLYFPDENHWVLKPHNSIQWHDEVMGWLTRWTE